MRRLRRAAERSRRVRAHIDVLSLIKQFGGRDDSSSSSLPWSWGRTTSADVRREALRGVGPKREALLRLVSERAERVSEASRGVWRIVQPPPPPAGGRGKEVVLDVARDDLGTALLDVCRCDADVLMRGSLAINFGNHERGSDYGGASTAY